MSIDMTIEKFDFVTEFWYAFVKCEQLGDFELLLGKLLVTPAHLYDVLNIEAAFSNIYLHDPLAFTDYIKKYDMTREAVTLSVYRSKFVRMKTEELRDLAKEIKDHRFPTKWEMN